MTIPRSSTRQTQQAGFTLLELLLVIALLAVMTSIALPQIASLLGDRRLVRAANVVSEEMMRLRIRAMREGKTYLMEGVLEEGTVNIRPITSLVDAVESYEETGSQQALLTGATQGTMIALEFDPEDEKVVELPDDVSVSDVAVVSSARAFQVEQQMLTAQSGMGRPIFFYPDGTTSTAAMVLKHSTDGQITIKMRGITGDVTIGEVQASP